MKPAPVTLYRDTPSLSVARFRLHQARTAQGFQPIRFSDPTTRNPKPSRLKRLISLFH